MKGLRDIVVPRPRVLFVGINPSLRSAEVGHHYAGRGNPFWRLLHAARLVSVALSCEEDQRVAEFGYGLTNLCARPTRSAAELERRDLEEGRILLEKKIAHLRPEVVALVGVTLYKQLFPKATTSGAGAKPETIAGARLYVLPNPSGLNASYPGFAHKLVWFEGLREFAGVGVAATTSDVAPCRRRLDSPKSHR